MNLENREIVITTPPEIIIPDFKNNIDTNRHKSQILRRRQMYFYLETCLASIIICLVCYFYLGK